MIKIELFDNSIKLGSSEYPKNSLSLNILAGSIISISYGNKIIIESILDNFTDSSDQVYSSIDNFLVDFRECFSTETPAPTFSGWALDGNTVTSEKWIGTTDNYAFPFRVNNVEVGRFTTAGLFRIGPSATTPTAFLDVAAGTTNVASVRIRAGVAPTTPNNGDVWLDSSGYMNFQGGVKVNTGSSLGYVRLRSHTNYSGFGAVYIGNITPAAGNYSIASDGTQTYVQGSTFGILNNETTIAWFTSSYNYIVNRTAIGQSVTATAFLDIAASTTSYASLRLRSGVAPTSPNNGDIWFDASNYMNFQGGIKVNTSTDTAKVHLRTVIGSPTLGSVYLGAGSPTSNNYCLAGSDAVTYLNGLTVIIAHGGGAVCSFDPFSNYISKATSIGHTSSATAWCDLAASDTSKASLRLRSGVAPTSPNNGDVWFDGTDIKMRIGGVTKTFTLT